ncbi:hypothetical protein NW759_017228 [Fusarium solani]|nr:hypothetical protein NW759_017228 [Fusarium solani]
MEQKPEDITSKVDEKVDEQDSVIPEGEIPKSEATQSKTPGEGVPRGEAAGDEEAVSKAPGTEALKSMAPGEEAAGELAEQAKEKVAEGEPLHYRQFELFARNSNPLTNTLPLQH